MFCFIEFGVGGKADASGDQLMEEGELSDHEDLRRTHLGKAFCTTFCFAFKGVQG